MVGDQQSFARRLASRQEPDAQRGEKLSRPARLEGQPGTAGQRREGERHRTDTPGQVQCDSEKSEGGADFPENSIQFWRSTKCRA
jgi:hypothetical protein